MPSIKFVNKCIQTQWLSTMLCSAWEDTVDKTAMSLSLESHIVLRKWDFTSFIAEKLRSQEAELTGRVRAMQAKRYNSWKACLYGSKNLANSRKWGLILNFLGVGHRGATNFTGGRRRGPPGPSWNRPWVQHIQANTTCCTISVFSHLQVIVSLVWDPF